MRDRGEDAPGPLDAVLAIARGHGLSLDRELTRLDESGADFLVAHAVDRAGAGWILRVPRRHDVPERAAAERRVLGLVAGRVPVEVPRWRVFSPELIAYPRLGGHPAAVVDPAAGGYVWRFDEKEPPAAFLDSLAGALAALHAIDPSEAVAAGLPAHDPAAARRAHAERMELSREVVRVPDAVWRRWQSWLEDDSFWPDRSVLVHGDLHPAHVLVDGEHRVTGLIDWSEARVSDPATDFTLQYATLGPATLADLLERYRRAGGHVWPRMAEHVAESWSAYPSMVAEFALRSGEEGPRRLAQALLDADSALAT